MKASKENCVRALTALDRLRASHGASEDAMFIGDFLASAAKRLPTEASLVRDAQRSRAKPKKTSDDDIVL